VTFSDGSDYVFFGPTFEDGIGVSGAFDEIWLSFNEPMGWLGVDFPGAIQISLFRSNELIYASGEFVAIGGQIAFGGLVSSEAFDSALLVDPEGGVFIDNLHFGPPIPAPGALALLGVGVPGVSRRRRR
jgi:MYXO-CTERM domain-containing protein